MQTEIETAGGTLQMHTDEYGTYAEVSRSTPAGATHREFLLWVEDVYPILKANGFGMTGSSENRATGTVYARAKTNRHSPAIEHQLATNTGRD